LFNLPDAQTCDCGYDFASGRIPAAVQTTESVFRFGDTVGWVALACAFVLVATILTRGCVESSFVLAPDSPLPRWFTLPDNLRRADVECELHYYVSLFGRSAKFVLRTTDGKTLARGRGVQFGVEPLVLGPRPPTGPLPYPSYEVITVNNFTEVIEHKRMEPIFHVNRDPAVRTQLRDLIERAAHRPGVGNPLE
jgi:hypothetical protein